MGYRSDATVPQLLSYSRMTRQSESWSQHHVEKSRVLNNPLQEHRLESVSLGAITRVHPLYSRDPHKHDAINTTITNDMSSL